MSSFFDDGVDIRLILYAGILIIALIIGSIRPINKVTDIRTIKGTVSEKGMKNNEGEGKYLVFVKDQNGDITVLEITDTLLKGRFDSSDLYGQIEEGATYTFTVGGSRVPFLSWYPNIYEIKKE